MKTVFKLVALVGFCLCLSACAPKNIAFYEQAQRDLGEGYYEAAHDGFTRLGDYRDAGQYAVYCRGFIALANEEWELAEADFENVFDFKLAKLYAEYAYARRLEAEGNLNDAKKAFRRLGTLRDSVQRVACLEELIPEKAYHTAQTLYEIGEYERAKEAFLALEDYRDSAAMAQACREAVPKKEEVVLAAETGGRQYAQIGGEGYYVISMEEGKAELICEHIVAILPVNMEGEVYAGFEKSSLQTYLNTTFKNALPMAVQSAVIAITLPDKEAVEGLSQSERMAFVKDGLLEYEPLVSSLQNGAWWLKDAGSLANSQAIVYYNGVAFDKGLPCTDTRIGVRPMLVLDTAVFPFTKGTGTKEDPLR